MVRELENKAQPPKIDMTSVAELSQQILQRKITTATFRLRIPLEQAYHNLTAFYIAEVKHRGMEYIDDSSTRMAIFKLAQSLTSPSPRCGVMLCGKCGNGKTTLVYALQSMVNSLNSCGHFKFLGPYFKVGMRIFDAKELVLLSRKLDEWRSVCARDMMAIDDLGKEPTEVLDYGNVTSPLVDLLEQRYQSQKFTVVTTNLAPKEIRGKYGERIADRFREMFEVIAFEFDSYRGKSERRNV